MLLIFLGVLERREKGGELVLNIFPYISLNLSKYIEFKVLTILDFELFYIDRILRIEKVLNEN